MLAAFDAINDTASVPHYGDPELSSQFANALLKVDLRLSLTIRVRERVCAPIDVCIQLPRVETSFANVNFDTQHFQHY